MRPVYRSIAINSNECYDGVYKSNFSGWSDFLESQIKIE